MTTTLYRNGQYATVALVEGVCVPGRAKTYRTVVTVAGRKIGHTLPTELVGQVAPFNGQVDELTAQGWRVVA